jgi:hypothetical protein
MNETGGWTIWGKCRERIRQFSVALPSDVEAIAVLKAENPDMEVLAKHVMSVNTLNSLGMTHGDITEWVPLDCKQKIARSDGQPTD